MAWTGAGEGEDAAAQVLLLLAGRGGAAYLGEPVTQLEHALQAADLAARAGETGELVLACLLHDIGWLIAAERPSGGGGGAAGAAGAAAAAGAASAASAAGAAGGTGAAGAAGAAGGTGAAGAASAAGAAGAAGGEGGPGHAGRGAALLAQLFDAAVAEPVRLHVAAKRFLAASEPGFVASLSAESRRTLALQGGPLAGEELAAFPALAHSGAALALRRYDDAAKVAGRRCPPLEAYAALARTLVRTA